MAVAIPVPVPGLLVKEGFEVVVALEESVPATVPVAFAVHVGVWVG